MSICAWLTLIFINNTFASYSYVCVSQTLVGYGINCRKSCFPANAIGKNVINEARAFQKGRVVVVRDNYIHVHH